MLNLDYKYIKSSQLEKYICILLHGYGDNKDNFAETLVPLFNLPNTSYIIPEAPQCIEYDNGYQWFPLDSDDNGNITINNIDDIVKADAKLHEFIHLVAKKFNMPLEKVLIFGFSQGGIMALFNALHTTNNFASVVCHSGAYFEHKSTVLNPNQNILLVHGKQDAVVPFKFMNATTSFFDKNHITYNTKFVDNLEHQITEETIKYVTDFFLKSME